MARYTGPKVRISRRFNEPILGDNKALQKKNYAPGQHGRGKKRKQSEYATQLAEKQKAKYIYGLLERQFAKLFDTASRKKGVTGEVLLQLLESRSTGRPRRYRAPLEPHTLDRRISEIDQIPPSTRDLR